MIFIILSLIVVIIYLRIYSIKLENLLKLNRDKKITELSSKIDCLNEKDFENLVSIIDEFKLMRG